ncbi:MAG: histidinol dehydrogenase [Planctomycetes bacterium]|nr:histidinol dehydrogenase [Planctomycetota bacterium]
MIPVVPWRPGAACPRLDAVLSRAEGPPPEVVARVAAIIDRVRREGDRALVALTRELDGVDLAPGELRVPLTRLEALSAGVAPEVRAALELAAANIRRFHEHQRERDLDVDDGDGVRLGQRVTPIGRVGLYVPGGTAAYPSSVLMNAVPAKVAGVPRVVAVTPPRALERTPALAAALLLAGVDEVHAVGGAQAVAALAYGTETVPRVDKVVGPGNLWVATAKRLVFGQVGIDSFAGPSEVVVWFDETADPAWVAADLLAQAEHDPQAAAIAVTRDAARAEAVAAEVARQVERLPRREVAEASLRAFGAVFVVKDDDDALALVERLAPEHLEVALRDPEAAAARVTCAGAIFLGAWSPEAVGDYLAGPNHVLPTAGTARFASALGVYDFVRRTSLIRYTPERLARTGPAVAALARAEGLEAHARSVDVRLAPRSETA